MANPYRDYIGNSLRYPVSALKLAGDGITQTANTVSALPGVLWDLLGGAALGNENRFDLQRSFADSGMSIPRMSNSNDVNRLVEGTVKGLGIPISALGTLLGTTGLVTDVNNLDTINRNPRLGSLMGLLGLGMTATPWMTGVPGMASPSSEYGDPTELRRRYERMTKIESPEESLQKKISGYLGGM